MGPRVADLSAPGVLFRAELFLNGKVTDLASTTAPDMDKAFFCAWGFPFVLCVTLMYLFSKLF